MRPGTPSRGLQLWGLAALLVSASPAAAQGIEGRIGRFYDDGGWNVYRLGLGQPLAGPLALGYSGSYLRRADGDGAFAGPGVDLTAFRGGGNGPYLVLGLSGGLGSPHSASFSSFWGSWSGGVGYELFPASALAFGAEVRWREIVLFGLALTAACILLFKVLLRLPVPLAPWLIGY